MEKRDICVWALLLVVVFTAVFAANECSAQDQRLSTWRWTAPTSGSPVAGYEVQANEDGSDWYTAGTAPAASPEFELAMTQDLVYEMRVRAWDAMGYLGPWSMVSDPETDLGPPGAPGQPSFSGIVAAAVFSLLILLALLFSRKRVLS